MAYLSRSLLNASNDEDMRVAARRLVAEQQAAGIPEPVDPPEAKPVDFGGMMKGLLSAWDDPSGQEGGRSDAMTPAQQPPERVGNVPGALAPGPEHPASSMPGPARAIQDVLASLTAAWRDPEPPAVQAGAPAHGVAAAGNATAVPPRSGTPQAMPQASAIPQTGDLRAYTRARAASLGIDPDVAERVFGEGEGGFDDPVRQSDVVYQGRREQSYGPAQLNIEGGLGSEALRRGIDPRNPADVYRSIDFALEDVAKNGWGAFHGAARIGVGPRQGIGQANPSQPMQTPADGPQPTTPTAAEETPQAQRQASGQVYSGPYTQQRLADAGDPDAWSKCGPVAAFQAAMVLGRPANEKEVEELARRFGWTAENGMAGLASEQKLLEGMNIAARATDAVDWQAVVADLQRGNPVILQLPNKGGHYVTAQRYDPQTGKIDFGSTVGDLAAARHKTQFTPQEFEGLGWGAPTGALFIDNPQSPEPSVVAGRVSMTAGDQRPPAGAQATVGGSGIPPAAADRGSPDPLREDTSDPLLMRGPLQPYDPDAVPTGEQPWESASSSTLMPEETPGRLIPASPTPSPFSPGQIPDSLTPSSSSMTQATGVLLTAPSDPTITDTAYTQGPFQQGMTPEPLGPEMPAERITRPGETPLRGPLPEPEPVAPPSRFGPPASQQQEASFDPVAILGQAGEAGRKIAEEINRAGRSQSGIIDPWATYQAIMALPFDVVARARQELISDAEARARSGIDPVAPFRALGIPLPSVEELNPEGRPASDLPLGAFAQAVVPDPFTEGLVGGGLRVAGAGARAATRGLEAGGRVLGEAAQDVGTRVTEGMRANQGRVANLDAQMAQQGSTVAPGTFGITPGGSFENLGSRLDTVRARLDEAGRVLDDAIDNGTDEALAQARRSYADVRREYDAIVASTELADTRVRGQSAAMEEAGYGRPMEQADTLPSELAQAGGRQVEVIPRTVDDTPRSANLNASTGPVGRMGSHALAQVNADIGSAVGSSTFGAAAGAALPAETDEERRRNALTGAAVGMVGGPVAGRMLPRTGGALATPGVSPGAGGYQPPPNLLQRFPGIQGAMQSAHRRQAAMAARGIQPLGPLQWTGEAIKNVGYSSMIGPATATVNVLGNLLEPLWAIPKEAVRSAARGNPREFGEMALGSFYGMGQTGREMLDALRARGRYASNPDQPRLSERTINPVGHALATATEAGGRLFSGLPDAFFGTIARHAGDARAAAQTATDEGLKGAQWKARVQGLLQDAQTLRGGGTPSDRATATRIMGEGDAYADRQTFRDDLGTWGKGASKWAGREVPVVGNFLTPFFTTPWNMNLAMLERSPVGAVMNRQKGFDKAYDATVGTALIAGLVMGPAATGQITGSGPADVEKRKMLEAEGWKPYHTLIGDTYVPNRTFGIYGRVLNAVGDVHDAMAYQKKDANLRDQITDAGKRAGRLVKEEPYLQGLADLLAVFDSAGSGVEGFAASNIARLVPYAATARAVGTAMDPSERQPDRGADVPMQESIRQRVQSSLGLRSDLPIAQDVLGRPRENQQQGIAAVLPRLSPKKAEPLVQAYRDGGVDIGGPPDNVSGVKLTPEQQRRYQQVMGRELDRLASPMVTAPNWQATSPDVKKMLLETFQSTARTLAEVAISTEGGAKFQQDRTKATVDKAMGR